MVDDININVGKVVRKETIVVILIFYTVFFLSSFLMGFPQMFALSNSAFVIAFIALYINNEILNSLTVPFPFIFASFTIDVIYKTVDYKSIFSILYHSFLLAITLYIVMKRWKSTRLFLILIASILYVLWITSVNLWIDDTYVNFFFIDPSFTWLYLLSGNTIIAIILKWKELAS